jgi:hypothetical protein
VCREQVEEAKLEVEAAKQSQANVQGKSRPNVTRRALSLSCEAIIANNFAAVRLPLFDSADGGRGELVVANNLPSSETEATSMIAR